MVELKKVVPVVAAGLAAAALGSADAYAAEELPTQPVDPAPPAEEAAQPAAAPSTEISTAVPVQTPEVPDGTVSPAPSEGSEETPAQNEVELAVNPGIDAEGSVTRDGTLTNTTTPGEPQEPVTVPTGDPTVTETTNPDGSTTTTTTTPTETTTTETSSSEITGEITDSGVPPQEEIDKVQTGWEQFIKDVEPTNGPDGSKIYTIEQSTKDDKPLTADELATVLGVTLTPVEGKENTYTYTTQDGKAVTVTTVTVTSDDSTETTTTKWTITVTEKSEEKHVEFLPSVTTKSEVSKDASEILNRISNKDDKITVVAWDETTGYVKKATEGSKTYEFSYEVTPKKVDLTNMSAAEIFKFLPQNEGYRLEGDKILDSNGNVLALNPEQSLLVQKLLIVSMTVTDSHGGVSSNHVSGKDNAEKEATKHAAVNAVLSAILRDIKGISEEQAKQSLVLANVEPNGYGAWTVTVSIGQVTYTYNVKTENAGDYISNNWSAEQIKQQQIMTGEDIASGFTTLVSNTAYVYGSTVVWSDTIEGKIPLTDDGKINIEKGYKLSDLSTVESVTHNENGTTTVVTKNATGVTKTYTFTYGVALTDAEKAALRIQLGQNQEYDFSKLTKTTWTVTVTSDRDVSSQHITTDLTLNSSGGKVVKVDDGYHYYLNEMEYIHFKDGKNGEYSFTDGNGKTYVLTVTKNTSPAPVTGTALDVLKGLIASCGILPDGYTFDKIDGSTAIYTNGNDTVRVSFDNIADEISVEVLEDTSFSEPSEKALKEAIIKWIMERDNVDEPTAIKTYEEMYLFINVGSSSETVTKYIRTALGTVDHNANGSQDQLLALLKQHQLSGSGTQNYTNPHIDVSVKVNLMPVGSSGGLEPDSSIDGGYLLPDFNVTLYATAEDLISNNPLAHSVEYTEKFWNYNLTLDDGDKLANANFYKITGTVAYDFFYEFDGIKNVAVSFSSKDEAMEYIDTYQLDYVPIHYSEYDKNWYLCKTAELTACNYMYDDSCADGGYTIDLGKLVLLKEKTDVTVPTYSYSTTITNKTHLGDAAISTLTLQNFNYTGIENGGSDISGSYQVTDAKTEGSLTDENGNWLHTGTGFDYYNTYQTWVETSSEKQNVATHEQYTGNLNYTYVENTTDVKVDASVEKDRDVQVKLDQTSVTTVPGEDTNTSTTPAPSNPGGSSSSGGSSGGSGSSSRPSSRPSSNPSTPANPSTPTDPSVNIPEEDVPLTNLPNEDVPLTSLPEEVPTEQAPVTELPEEDVPLAETPVLDREVSAASTRIADAQAPLADVPETGDPMLMEAFAAVAAGANALWFTMGKKRRDDTD